MSTANAADAPTEPAPEPASAQLRAPRGPVRDLLLEPCDERIGHLLDVVIEQLRQLAELVRFADFLVHEVLR